MKRLLVKTGLIAMLGAALLVPTLASAENLGISRKRAGTEKAIDHEAFKKGDRNLLHQIKKNSRKAPDQSKLFAQGDLKDMRVNSRSASQTRGKTARLITRSAESPRGHIYGAVGDYQDMEYLYQAFWGELDIRTGHVTKLFSGAEYLNGNDYVMQGGVVRGNIYYTPVVEETLEYTEVIWNRINIQTGEVLKPKRWGEDWAAYCYAMTYNPVDDKFYCLSLDWATKAMNQLTIVKFVGDELTIEDYVSLPTDDHLGGIAYNPKDNSIYVFSQFNDVYRLRKTNSDYKLSRAGELECLETIVDEGVTAQIVYSPLDAVFVAIYRDYEARCMRLMYIDPEDWSVSQGVVIGSEPYNTPYFIALYCPDQYAEQSAPELPAQPAVDVNKDDLFGSYTFTAPELNFAGIAFKPTDILKAKLVYDGKVVITKDMAPGESETYEFSGEEGIHKFELSFTYNDEVSPVRITEQYLGNDTPARPTNLKFKDYVLTWDAPSGFGANNGYVDTAALTYDVFIGNEQQNAAPLTETTYTLTVPEYLAKSDISVTATANAKTSEKATVTEIIGKALTLPCGFAPSIEDSQIFRTLDANNDENMFIFTGDYNENYYYELWLPTNRKADDWLFMPLMSFPDAEHLYNMVFSYRDAQTYYGCEDLDIYLGKEPTPAAMTRNIYSVRQMTSNRKTDISVDFAVPEAGDWYIGFHCTSSGTDAGGCVLSDFDVMGYSDKLSNVPGDPTAVTITAAPLGALSADFEITLPAVDARDNPLPADKEISVNVSCTGGKASASGLPGAKVKLTVPVKKSGSTTFIVQPANENGVGLSRRHTYYVGIDTPLAPKNIRALATADNRSVQVLWDKPGNVGRNAGYVDPDKLTYNFYNVVGVQFYLDGRTDELEYTYTPTVLPNQERYVVGPVASNEMGESYKSDFLSVILGTPYTIPAFEEFGNTGWSYEPVFFNTAGIYSESVWESAQSVSGFQTGASVDCDNGCLFVYSTGTGKQYGELVLPKINTTGSKNAYFKLRHLDWEFTPIFSVWALKYGAEEPVLIGTTTPSRYRIGRWIDQEFPLPDDLNDCPWVQFFVRVEMTSETREYGFIDSYTVSQDVDKDLKLQYVSGPDQAYVGDHHTYEIKIMNSGREATEGSLTVRLKDKDGNVLKRQDFQVPRVAVNRASLTNFTVWLESGYEDISPLTLEAYVTCDGDEIEPNNLYSLPINVVKSMAPVVKDLTAAWSDDRSTAQLSWSTPNLEYGGHDGFELLEPFQITDNLGLWRNVDMDGGEVWGLTNGSNDFTWPGWNKPQAWTVINAEKLGTQYDNRMGGHGGKQFLIARGVQFDETDESTMVQSADWLISPEVVGGTDVTFWYCAVSSQYKEYVEIWYSDTDDNLGEEIRKPNADTSVDATCGSFKYHKTFSKSGEEAWEKVTFQLPENAKYFAFVNRGWDGIGAMIDDVSFVQAKPSVWEIDHYSVWRITDGDWSTYECVAPDVKGTTYVDTNVGDRNVTYYVCSAVKSGASVFEGSRSNPAVLHSSAVGEIGTNPSAIRGGKGAIYLRGFAGQTANVYDLEGRLLRTVPLDADSVTLPIDAGLYLVAIGNARTKVVVK